MKKTTKIDGWPSGPKVRSSPNAIEVVERAGARAVGFTIEVEGRGTRTMVIPAADAAELALHLLEASFRVQFLDDADAARKAAPRAKRKPTN
jgi:hypothetical protein